jgi:hypothetical protein
MKDRVIYDSPYRITQHYKKGVHNGVDLGWRTDESMNRVFANCVGTVYKTLDNIPHGSETGGGWGNYVLIKHPNGMFSRYAHLKKGLLVSKGQYVTEETQLGIIGDTGRATARHLHFEVSTSDCTIDRINPEPYLTNPIYTESPSGDETIKNIQRTLNARYDTNLVIDGIYGSLTHKAFIVGLQKELNSQFHAGLVPDGIFGPKTKNACITVRYGARGNITYLIQSKLYVLKYNIIIDSIYGNNTQQQIKNFQKNNGLSSDGICGKNTFEKLFK